MEYLADTVAIIRHFAKSGKLGQTAQEIFKRVESGDDTICISVISIAEVMYLAEKNRISLKLDALKENIESSVNYKLIDLTIDIILVANRIHDLELHDRLIVASARYLDIPLITSDRKIQESGQVTIKW